MGLDECETRSRAGWHNHIVMCLLGLQQDWGKKTRIIRPKVYRVVRDMLPRERFRPEELLLWLMESQLGKEGTSRSHEKRRSARGKVGLEPPP